MTAQPASGFPSEAAERLGPFYVYTLVDSRTESVFYVGKGSRQRLLAHGREADLTKDEGARSAKVQRIRELRAAGLEPRVDIVRHGLDEATAFEVEAALIDSLPQLTNLASGHGTARGRLPLEEYVTRYAAPLVAEDAPPVVLIRIRQWKDQVEVLEPGTYRRGNGYWPGIPTSALIDSTRAWWRISPTTIGRRGIEHAVAVFDGVTRAALRIGDWIQRDDGRRAFSAELVEEGPVFDAWVGELGRRVEFVTAARNPITYWPRETS